MVLRLLKHPAVLASLAAHGGVFVVGTFLGWGGPRTDRAPLLLGMEASDVSGTIDQDAPLPEPANEAPLEFADLPIPVEPPPADAPELPPDDAPDVAAVPPAFEPPPVGARKAPLARSESVAPAASPSLSPLPAPLPPPRASAPVLPASASRKGSISEDRPAERIGNTKPAYPTEALRQRWEGTTVLDVRVTTDGFVESASVYQSSGYAILDEAAVAACVGYRYLPRLVEGVAARAWLRQPFVWSLERP